ncbi:ubiquitin carboxyl-terminal hydrolase [Lobosporangium transversale]|uniref:Ubiquitin carboxyl-terminal hydrolase n=1 Tax=Lobosporangium transversale TaxID=64571 RepID=A0A1Y2G935_9FUNG|nr:ubiquitin carboxyl-terminal hydrolase [Lobosporangium transversale]ORZ04532.1 ubiquitin carboxyl-terminal hydrolase [Lobosporangium transversale]|eukprot:XP_021876578.1 ubiquitin carboxyl-terminal hydrolase [Lobosporangium transversale]
MTNRITSTVDPAYVSLGGHWCTIESSPAVFNALIQKNGVRGAYIKEVWSLDREIFDLFKKETVYGFIFLLKSQGRRLSKVESMGMDVDTSNIYFANQVIPDACGTQALLSIVLNSPTLDIGPMLNEFKEFTSKFDPKDKGLAMTNCKELRENHNSLTGRFERQPILPLPFLMEIDGQENPDDDDTQFHYVAYVHMDGYVWELDGLQPEPLRLMPCTEETWLDVVRIELMARMRTYGEEEGHFVLMAVIKDPMIVLHEKLDKLRVIAEASIARSTSVRGNQQEQEKEKEKGKHYIQPTMAIVDEIAAVEQEIETLEQGIVAEQREIQETEADFQEAINIFMKAYVEMKGIHTNNYNSKAKAEAKAKDKSKGRIKNKPRTKAKNRGRKRLLTNDADSDHSMDLDSDEYNNGINVCR